jgi:hypothetical protein
VALFDKDTVLIGLIKYRIQETDISYGRAITSSSRLGTFETPTPTKENVGAKFAVPDSVRVVFDDQAGLYTSSVSVGLNSSWDAPIYYTLDGGDPTTEDYLYKEPIQIDSNTVLRASVIKNEYQPRVMGTHTFLIGEKSTLSILSLSTDPDNLWRSSRGIYKNYEKRGWLDRRISSILIELKRANLFPLSIKQLIFELLERQGGDNQRGLLML